MPSKKLALGIILTFLLTITYQSIAGYLTSPYTGLKYPNPGHYANEIGPGTFFCDISDLPNCFWKFPAKVIIEGILNLTGHDILGVNKVEANKVDAKEICIGGECKDSWAEIGGAKVILTCDSKDTCERQLTLAAELSAEPDISQIIIYILSDVSAGSGYAISISNKNFHGKVILDGTSSMYEVDGLKLKNVQGITVRNIRINTIRMYELGYYGNVYDTVRGIQISNGNDILLESITISGGINEGWINNIIHTDVRAVSFTGSNIVLRNIDAHNIISNHGGNGAYNHLYVIYGEGNNITLEKVDVHEGRVEYSTDEDGGNGKAYGIYLEGEDIILKEINADGIQASATQDYCDDDSPRAVSATAVGIYVKYTGGGDGKDHVKLLNVHANNVYAYSKNKKGSCGCFDYMSSVYVYGLVCEGGCRVNNGEFCNTDGDAEVDGCTNIYEEIADVKSTGGTIEGVGSGITYSSSDGTISGITNSCT